MEKLIITAAICGAEVLKEHNPAVPYTVEECAREAKSAYDAARASSTCTCATTTANPRRIKTASNRLWTLSVRFART